MHNIQLTRIDQSLLLAAYFRGGSQDDHAWTSNADQVLTLSLFYSGDISAANCVGRFEIQSYIQKLYDEHAGTLAGEIESRYRALINMLHQHPELIEGGGDFDTPAHPTFTACRLTDAGLKLAETLMTQFPKKPHFPNWPNRRIMPEAAEAE